MTFEKYDSSVCLLKNPSQAKAVPQAKAASRSSEPSSVVMPGGARAAGQLLANTYDSDRDTYQS